MKTSIKILVLAFFLCSSFLNAETIYVTQSGAGSNTGSSIANAYSLADINSSSNWGAGVAKVSPGDTVLLHGTFTAQLLVAGNGMSGSPVTIKFDLNTKFSAPFWTSSGAIRLNGKSNIVIDGGVNGLIEATDNGTSLLYQNSGGTGVNVLSSNKIIVKNLNVRDIYLRKPNSSDNTAGSCGIVISGNSNHNEIMNNNIINSENGILWAYGQGTKGVSIHDNVVTGVSNCIMVGSSNDNASVDSVLIYNNDLSDGVNWDGIWTNGHWFHNDGIQVFAVHNNNLLTNLRIYGNYVHGDFGVHTTAFIFLSGGNGRQIIDPLVYNNYLEIDSSASATSNGFIFCREIGGAKIFNNTIKSAHKGTGVGIAADNLAYGRTNKVSVLNNLFYEVRSGIFVAANGSGNELDTCDYNIYYNLGEAWQVPGQVMYHQYFYTWSAWQAQGYDIHSDTANPLLINGYKVQSGSNAISAGINFSNEFNIDIDANKRTPKGNWTIGCYEYDNCSKYECDLGKDTTICTGNTISLESTTLFDVYKWSTGDTTSKITVNSSGVFGLETTHSNGCISADTIEVSFIPCTGVEELEHGQRLSIYPNPIRNENGYYTLSADLAIDELANVEWYNSFGQKVAEQVVSSIYQNKQVALPSNLCAGTYFVRVVNQGSIIGRTKLLIQ